MNWKKSRVNGISLEKKAALTAFNRKNTALTALKRKNSGINGVEPEK